MNISPTSTTKRPKRRKASALKRPNLPAAHPWAYAGGAAVLFLAAVVLAQHGSFWEDCGFACLSTPYFAWVRWPERTHHAGGCY